MLLTSCVTGYLYVRPYFISDLFGFLEPVFVKVEFNWTRAIRPVMAQSVQFRTIAKKLNIDLCQFFFSSKGITVLIKIMK